MRISSAFPSKFLKASDLQGREVQVKIDDVAIEVMEQTGEEKPVLRFIGTEKGLVLNKTNSDAIATAYGDETDSWHGQPIILFEATTSYGGRTVPCLRVRIPRPVAKPAPVAARPPAQVVTDSQVIADDSQEDEVPF